MSGHSKWATIKRQKGANDIKRGLIFTKFSNAITVAVRQGGLVTDPEGNFRLRLAIEAARRVNMPKENIERAIARAVSKQEADLLEVVYEGFGPGGFSVVVEAFTDNKQRTVSEVKNAFVKNGGSMGAQGTVMYQFARKGMLIVERGDRSLDDIFLLAADSGAEDVEEEEQEVIIYTRPEDMVKIRTFLAGRGITILSAELIYRPINLFTISDKTDLARAIAFLKNLEDLSDVQKVFANFDNTA